MVTDQRLFQAEQEISALKSQVQDLMMRLSAIKVITQKISPVCSEKLQKLFEECEGCKGESD